MPQWISFDVCPLGDVSIALSLLRLKPESEKLRLIDVNEGSYLYDFASFECGETPCQYRITVQIMSGIVGNINRWVKREIRG